MIASRTRDSDPTLESIVAALRVAMNDSPSVAFVLDADLTILMVNPHLCAMHGATEEKIVGTSFDVSSRLTNPETLRDALAACFAGETSQCTGRGTLANGKNFVSHITLLPLRVDGHVVAVFVTTTDTTERELSDAHTRQNDELFRLIGQLARFGGWSVDAATGTITMTSGARAIFDLDPTLDDITELAWSRLDANDRVAVEMSLEKCLTDGAPFETETLVYSSSGERVTVRTVGEAERDAAGTIVRVFGAMWDVTDVVTARDREQALEWQLGFMLDSIADGIVFTDEDGGISFANQHALDLLNRDSTELAYLTLDNLFSGPNNAGFRECFAAALSTRDNNQYRGAGFSPGQSIECEAFPANDGLVVYIRDVTADERSRRLARDAQAKVAQQAALLDAARDAIVVRDLGLRVQFWNKAAEDLYGWSRDEAMGQRVSDLIYSNRAELDRATAIVMRDGYFVDEMHQVTRDGRQLIMDCRWQLIPDLRGENTLILAVDSDITEWRREQDARMRAQRMEALGTFAGGIAHDLNNVLTPILMSVQLLALDEVDATRRELLGATEAAVKRGSDMVRQVLSFVRGIDGRRISVDMNRLIDEFVTMTRKMLPNDVRLEVHRSHHLPPTMGDPTQLIQVLMNLATNARDEMAAGGTLTVSAEEIDVDEGYVSVSHSPSPGRYVSIAIEDTGHGIAHDLQGKIFEPFFTTKPSGKGTGLGLATSLAIVRSHGGFMTLSSGTGGGSRFAIGLPVASDTVASEAIATGPSDPMPAGNGEMVLVIDDDDDICRVAAVTLESHGYRTLTARDGRAAIDLVESGEHVVDLVLTDMMMPVMDGAATSAYLEEHHPHIPIIAASGLTAGGPASLAIGLGISRFMSKPYTTSELLTAVHDTLRQHRSAEGEDDE